MFITPQESFLIANRGSIFSATPDELARQLDLLEEAKKLEVHKPKCAREAARLSTAFPCSERAAHAGMIDPDSVCKLIWDWIVIAFVLYCTVELPVDIAFFDIGCKQLQVRREPRGE